MNFNPHARVGRDDVDDEYCKNALYFNPHARVGRDVHSLFLTDKIQIISIHTPAWGVTQPRHNDCDRTRYFNPHARVGRDYRRRERRRIYYHFNPHARVGRDFRRALITLTLFTFQSTRPRGA